MNEPIEAGGCAPPVLAPTPDRPMTQHEARTGDKTMHDEAERPALVGGEDGLRAALTLCHDVLAGFANSTSDRPPWGEFARAREAAEAALALPAAQDGVTVPREPTEAMVNAARGFSVPGYCIAAEQWPAVYRAMLAAAPTPNAIRGDKGAEAVAFRFLKHLAGGVYAWTRWLNMDELHHYGEGGNLVQGPHPDWQIEYAYAAPTQAAAKDTP